MNSAVNIFPGFIPCWKGFDSAVSTVPGWKAISSTLRRAEYDDHAISVAFNSGNSAFSHSIGT
jgi:hypothetical protein